MADGLGAMQAYYAQDKERDRLAVGLGRVDLARTIEVVERTLPPIVEAGFTGYTHRPDELRDEVAAAGFDVRSLVSLEGIAFALADLDERWADDADRALLLDTLRALESVPELLGVGPHLLATGRRI